MSLPTPSQLESARQAKGWSYGKVASLAEVDRNTVIGALSGQVNTGYRHYLSIVEALGCENNNHEVECDRLKTVAPETTSR